MPETRENAIVYQIRDAGGQKGIQGEWQQGGNQISLTCQVAWSDFDQWSVDMLGYSEYDPAAVSATGLHRQTPETHPDYPKMFCTNLRLIEVIGTFDQASESAKAELSDDAIAVVQVTYRNVRYRVLEDDHDDIVTPASEMERFVTRDRKYGVEALPLKGVQFVAAANANTVVATEPTIIYPSGDVILHWHQVPSQDRDLPALLSATHIATAGCVNDAEFLGYSAETLLCMPPQVEERLNVLGALEYEITYTFSWRPCGWNHKFMMTDPSNSAAIADFYPVVIRGTNTKPYLTADFDELFTLV